jgi:hypothetical protein
MLNALSLSLVLAAAEAGVESKFIFKAGMREGLIIVGAVSVLTVLILVWAISLRKPRRRHGSRRAPEAPATLVRYRTEQHEDTGLLSLLKSKRRRRKRRFHHRNPTLAETGGLPPMREGPPPTPCPPKET